MFQQRIEQFGKWEKRIFEDLEKNCRFSIVPAYGATVLEFVFKGKNILDSYSTPAELEAGEWSKSALLFPFPNRLKDGKYQLDDKTYQFPINDKGTQNALHGLGMQKPFSIKSIELSANEAKINCRYEDDGMDEAYPFPFVCEISFLVKISKENEADAMELEVEMIFENKFQQRIPVGLGWHPYFVLSKKVENCFLQMPPCQIIEVDERLTPTGKKYNYDIFNEKRKIGNVVLDNGFEIKNKKGRAELIMEGEYGKLHYWQEAGDRLWNFIQVFILPNKRSIAIEPMTCNIDAFNNRDGLVLLESGAVMKGKFGFMLSEL